MRTLLAALVAALTVVACGADGNTTAGRIPDFPEQCVGKDGL